MYALARIPAVLVATVALFLATTVAVVAAPEHSGTVVAGPERCC
jgi:hypothetical protein